ncbi:uncharacterized protein LOC143296141 [Babylonia areolata]|uniref:uncharacterized protein LOC143296141 n=1 Tax=Babylonia areolata TaxID=304850 RepID=UPI003FD30C71
MLIAPYTNPDRPHPPPRSFLGRAKISYKAAHPFSHHDDRNTIQDYGEYFGDGKITRFLGRKLLQPMHSRQDYTDSDFLMHHCRDPTLYSYSTEVSSNYTGRPATSSSAIPSKRQHPHLRQQPSSGPLRPLTTMTTEWCPEVPRSPRSIRTSNHVLAQSLKPYLKNNTWKYSYHRIPKAYPL